MSEDGSKPPGSKSVSPFRPRTALETIRWRMAKQDMEPDTARTPRAPDGIWRPLTQMSDVERSILAAPYTGTSMNPDLHRSLLRSKLARMVDQSPEAARRILQTRAEYAPELMQIYYDGEPGDWPAQIVASDLMCRFLVLIDWDEESRSNRRFEDVANMTFDEFLEHLV